jgi:hypothetical protein
MHLAPMTAPRKYRIEHGLNMVADRMLLLQGSLLSGLEDDAPFGPDHPLHIYFVLQRPRLALAPKSVTACERSFHGVLTRQVGDTFEEYPFQVANEYGVTSATMESEYPHTEVTVHDGRGGPRRYAAVSQVAMAIPRLAHLTDLEVLYVGQAYGAEGERTAISRLKNHSTLQNIYAEALTRSPDSEVWLLLVEFAPTVMFTIDGQTKDVLTSMEDDLAHTREVFRRPISEQQSINFAEAALIRYFQPRFNELFKRTFPNPAHATYSECYDVDLNTLIVELDTEELGTRLWTNGAPVNHQHFARFNLHNSEMRRDMFHLCGVAL